MKIAVVTMWTPSFAPMAKPVNEIRKLYCQKHGYELIVRENIHVPGQHIGWLKYFVLQSVMQETDADFLFWNDADALVWNHDIPVESFIDDDHDLFIAFDGVDGGASWRPQARKPLDCINVGNMIIRNKSTFLADVCSDSRYLCWRDKPYWEQTALEEYIHDHPDFQPRVKVLKPKNMFNFADGPFLRHALGFSLTPAQKGQLLKQYMSQIRIDGVDHNLSHLYPD